jgi:hypothetical protein
MTKRTEKRLSTQPEALATSAAAARNKGVKRAGPSATPETEGKHGNLAAQQKDAADIIGGNATGDEKRVDAPP